MSFTRPNIVRPPPEDGSYYLPLTSGCSNSLCGFCNYFYGHRLRVRELADVKKEIDALALYVADGRHIPEMPEAVYAIADQWDGRRVFLQDGDALVYPYPDLKEALQYLNQKIPFLEKITCFATTQDVLLRGVAELRALKDLKLGILYLGVESGDDSILSYVNKGVNATQTVAAGKRIKAAGIHCAVTFILGLGGVEKSREHALATAKILSELDPDSAEALTLTLVPGTPMYDQNQRGEFSLISPVQSLQELKTIIVNSNLSNCLFRSVHASNYLPIQGKLPRDKSMMVSQLDYIIENPALLRPEYLRGL